MYSKIYEDQSLFHHFSHNSEVILLIEQKYQNLIKHGHLIEYERQIPFVLLKVDSLGLNAI